MPIQRFRSVEDMPDEVWREPGDPALYRAIRGVWEAGRRMRPRRFPAGVYKYRSIEDMNAQQERWDADHTAEVAAQLRRASDLPPAGDS